MRVKILGALALATIGTAPLQAQENLMEMVRSDVRAEAQQIMAVALQLTDEQAQIFWPMYREYELDRSKWGDSRLGLIKQYAEQYEMMSDAAAAELVESWFAIQADRMELYKGFYNRVSEALGASVAARFLQVENQLGMLIDLQIAQEMPLVFKVEGN